MAMSDSIVDRLIDDLTSRSGFDGLWDSLDKDIQQEICEEWSRIVDEVLG